MSDSAYSLVEELSLRTELGVPLFCLVMVKSAHLSSFARSFLNFVALLKDYTIDILHRSGLFCTLEDGTASQTSNERTCT